MPGTYERYAASSKDVRTIVIQTVDPARSLIQGAETLDGPPIVVTVGAVPPAFAWPQQGDYWTVEREGKDWNLLGRVQNPAKDDFLIEAAQPGDLVLNGKRVVANGVKVARAYQTEIEPNSRMIVNHRLDTIGVVCQLNAKPLQTLITSPVTRSSENILVENASGFDAAGYIYTSSETIRYTSRTDTSFSGLTRGEDFDIWPEGMIINQPKFPPPFTYRVVNENSVEVSIDGGDDLEVDLTFTVIG